MKDFSLLQKKIKPLLMPHQPICIVLGGFPGSGKTTVRNEFTNRGFLCVCKDDIRLFMARHEYGNLSENELEDKLQTFEKPVAMAHTRITQIYLDYILHQRKPFSKYVGGIDNDLVISYVKKCYNECNNQYKGIVFDATHFTTKQRTWIINLINNRMRTVCLYLVSDIDTAYNGVQKRVATVVDGHAGRNVPKDVIIGMAKCASLPSVNEGFDEIIIYNIEDKMEIEYPHRNALSLDNCRQFNTYAQCDCDFDQHNKHHGNTLFVHLTQAFKYALHNKYPYEVQLAALYHDVGKIATQCFCGKLNKEFEDLKVGTKVVLGEEKDETIVCNRPFNYKKYTIPVELLDQDGNGHFYGHDNVSAIKAFTELDSMGMNRQVVNDVYLLVRHHMMLPFNHVWNRNDINTLSKQFTYEQLMNLCRLRICDEYATVDANITNHPTWNESAFNQSIKYVYDTMKNIADFFS